jgi:hypothetical protein
MWFLRIRPEWRSARSAQVLRRSTPSATRAHHSTLLWSAPAKGGKHNAEKTYRLRNIAEELEGGEQQVRLAHRETGSKVGTLGRL